MLIKFDVKIAEKHMKDFMLYHHYTSFSGIASVVFGLLTAALGSRAFLQQEYQNGLVFFLFTAVFLIYMPVTLGRRAKLQVKKTPMFQAPIAYEFNEEGIVVSQGEESALNTWDHVSKVTATNQSMLIYFSRMRALILPKEAIGDQYAALVQLISTHVAPAKVKLKQVR